MCAYKFQVVRLAKARSGALAALLAALVAAAHAGPTTVVYGFTGTGGLSADGGFITTPGVHFKGKVTLVVNPANQPNPNAQNQALAMTGWVAPSFDIQYLSLGNWYTLPQAAHIPGETKFDTETVVRDDYLGSGRDELFTQFDSQLVKPVSSGQYVQVSRTTLDRYTNLSWLNGFAFATDVGLAPGDATHPAYNHLVFQDTIYNPDSQPIPGNITWHTTGTTADISLSSLVEEVAASGNTVPEPRSEMLAAVALGIAGLARRAPLRRR